jgi:hypothetical protein
MAEASRGQGYLEANYHRVQDTMLVVVPLKRKKNINAS